MQIHISKIFIHGLLRTKEDFAKNVSRKLFDAKTLREVIQYNYLSFFPVKMNEVFFFCVFDFCLLICPATVNIRIQYNCMIWCNSLTYLFAQILAAFLDIKKFSKYVWNYKWSQWVIEVIEHECLRIIRKCKDKHSSLHHALT